MQNTLILKTDINFQSLARLKNVFDYHQQIVQWSVDLDDCDRVLRIIATGNLQEQEVTALVKPFGVFCEDLGE